MIVTLTSSLASKVFAFDSQTSHCCFPLEDIVGLILLSTLLLAGVVKFILDAQN